MSQVIFFGHATNIIKPVMEDAPPVDPALLLAPVLGLLMEIVNTAMKTLSLV